MNKIKYDEPRIAEMQDFLDYIYEIANANKDLYITPNTVYHEFTRWGLRKQDMNEDRSLINIREYFEEWFYQLNGKNNNLLAYSTEGKYHYWAQFNNNTPDAPYIKLYIPMDKEHIGLGVQQLFSFVSTLGVSHTSKVGEELRSDGIVIRVSKEDIPAALKIVDFVNSNPYIREGLLKPNPFLSTVDGVGWMVDYGRSYNGLISDSISHYITSLVRSGGKPTVQGLYDGYIKRASSEIPSKPGSKLMAVDIKNVFEVASGIKPREIEELEEFQQTQPLSLEQKKSLFMDAIKVTYSKYGVGQVSSAINAIITNNNYNLISNGSTNILYRKELQRHITPKEVEGYIREMVEKLNPDYAKKSTPEVIKFFTNFFFSNDLAMKFYDACMVTYDKHGADWLQRAIYAYLYYENANGFSRYVDDENKNVNYRLEITKIGVEESMLAMKKYLRYMGITTSNMDGPAIIYAYVDALGRSRYDTAENTAKIA